MQHSRRLGPPRIDSAWIAATVALACWSHAPWAIAAVYKCSGAGGTPIYQEAPCPPGTELRNFQTDPPAVSVLPAPETAVHGSAPRIENREAGAPRPAAQARGSRDATGDASQRRHAHAGMTEAEVVAKLGRPQMTATGGRKGKTRWTYLPADADPDTITTLYLDHGTVVEVERRVVKH